MFCYEAMLNAFDIKYDVEKNCRYVKTEFHMALPVGYIDGKDSQLELYHAGYTILHAMADPLRSTTAMHEQANMRILLTWITNDKLYNFMQSMSHKEQNLNLSKICISGINFQLLHEQAGLSGLWS